MTQIIRVVEFFLNQPMSIKILIVYVLVVFFIIFDDGEKKRRKRLKGCPVGLLQEQLRGAARENRRITAVYERQKSDLCSSFQQTKTKLERDNSYLRSRLYK